MVEIIKETIRGGYELDRPGGRDWILDNNVKIRAPHRHSFGFSLDNPGKPPLAFFSGSPPKNIAKMCDAIVALSHREKLYLFLVEQKTANLDQCQKQLANGKFFCDWLFSLYKWHGYCTNDPVYIGLLIWQPRPLPQKEETAYRAVEVKRKAHNLFTCFFEIRNECDINLKKLVESSEEDVKPEAVGNDDAQT